MQERITEKPKVIFSQILRQEGAAAPRTIKGWTLRAESPGAAAALESLETGIARLGGGIALLSCTDEALGRFFIKLGYRHSCRIAQIAAGEALEQDWQVLRLRHAGLCWILTLAPMGGSFSRPERFLRHYDLYEKSIEKRRP